MQTSGETNQPFEDGHVTISRAAGSITFPARFMLVAAMNPCPCGYYGYSNKQCQCSVRQIENYRQKISGPLLDRILKVSRTLADLAGEQDITGNEILEAIQFRSVGRRLFE